MHTYNRLNSRIWDTHQIADSGRMLYNTNCTNYSQEPCDIKLWHITTFMKLGNAKMGELFRSRFLAPQPEH
eukprot:scaffold48836_cov32-Tisochrysis_lutea.AAC.5